MNDTKFSELDPVTAVASPDFVAVVQGGVSKRADVSLLGPSIDISATSPITVTPDPITDAGAIGLDVSINHAFTSFQSITITDENVDSAVMGIDLIHKSTDTPESGFGTGFDVALEDSTNTLQGVGSLTFAWEDATHASPKSTFIVVTRNGSLLRLFDSGGLSLQNQTDPGNGWVNVTSGYKINNVALSASDVGASPLVFPDSDPHIVGAGYWLAGVLTRSNG